MVRLWLRCNKNSALTKQKFACTRVFLQSMVKLQQVEDTWPEVVDVPVVQVA